MMTPDTGRIAGEAIVSAMPAVFDKSGEGILFTQLDVPKDGLLIPTRTDF
jgi:hypothetical protein